MSEINKNIYGQYAQERYATEPDPILDDGFTNYDRLMVELNNRMYYDEATYRKFLNENNLYPEHTYDKNTDHAQLLETVYSILMTLSNNIDVFRKVETEFVTQGEALTALQLRLKNLRADIERIKAEMHYDNSAFTFMYYTR